MNGHEEVRKLLPLAAAGALSRSQLSAVEGHAVTCAECRRELEVWRLYSRGLHELPQPVTPAGLMQRTAARLARERDAVAERRRHDLTLGLLVAFSWVIGALSWIPLRAVVGGIGIFTWVMFSSLLTWTTAGVAAVLLLRRKEWIRRLV